MTSLHAGESEGQPGVDPPDPSPDPAEDVAQRDEHRLLFEALARLGPPESRCRQLIKLVYFAGFTYDEVGQTMDMKPKTVGAALSRCLDQLQGIASNVFFRGKIAGTAAEP